MPILPSCPCFCRHRFASLLTIWPELGGSANGQYQEKPSIPAKIRHGEIAPHDDAYTVRDGHFVGHDGFIVPNCFIEFHQRFPTYVADWVRKRVRDCVSATEAEDWTQELLLHLAVLPTCSKYRRDGKEDVIQSFSPERMHGANEARFRSFINQCLSNKFNTLYVRWRKRPLSNPGNLPFEADTEHRGFRRVLSFTFRVPSASWTPEPGTRGAEIPS